jgi:hypothetical protein
VVVFISIAERRANHEGVALNGGNQIGWSGHLCGKLDQMIKAEQFQWADLATRDVN